MKKSLVIIASALLFAVGAASHHRLRYDSSVFADSAGPAGGPHATRLEYPPCVKGVREDRCIQLYERGVRRSYRRWLASQGRDGEQVAARGPVRTYPTCRGRNDDRCQQRSVRRQARAVRQARARQAQRRAAAVRRAAPRRAVASRPQQRRVAVVRQTRAPATQIRTRTNVAPRRTTTVQRQRPVTRPSGGGGGGTPGI